MAVRVSNVSEVSFGVPVESWGTPTHVVLKNTDFQQVIPLSNNAIATEARRQVIFETGALVFTFPSSAMGFSDASMVYILNKCFAETAFTLSLHTGDPGADGTANVVTAGGYSDATLSVGTLTATEVSA